MANNPRDSLYLVLFGLVITLAYVLVVTTVSQYALASIETAGTDIAKSIEAGNATIIPLGTNQTIDGNMTEVEFLAIQRAPPLYAIILPATIFPSEYTGE